MRSLDIRLVPLTCPRSRMIKSSCFCQILFAWRKTLKIVKTKSRDLIIISSTSHNARRNACPDLGVHSLKWNVAHSAFLKPIVVTIYPGGLACSPQDLPTLHAILTLDIIKVATKRFIAVSVGDCISAVFFLIAVWMGNHARGRGSATSNLQPPNKSYYYCLSEFYSVRTSQLPISY